MNELNGLQYIKNYLYTNYGFRNTLKNVTMETYIHYIDDDAPENYIILTRNKHMGEGCLNIDLLKGIKFHVKLIINAFSNHHIIKDKKFIKELRNLKLNDNDYLIKLDAGVD